MKASRILMSFIDGLVFFFFILGLILLGVSYNRAKKNEEKIAEMAPCTEETTATVTHLNIFTEKVNKDDIDSPTREIYDAKYTFTVNGQEYSGNYDSKKKIEEGDVFEIVYDPSDPNHCYLKSEKSKELSSDVKQSFFYYPSIFLIVASLVVAIPLAILQIIHRVKENKKWEEEYQRAVERHQAEMEAKNMEGRN